MRQRRSNNPTRKDSLLNQLKRDLDIVLDIPNESKPSKITKIDDEATTPMLAINPEDFKTEENEPEPQITPQPITDFQTHFGKQNHPTIVSLPFLMILAPNRQTKSKIISHTKNKSSSINSKTVNLAIKSPILTL